MSPEHETEGVPPECFTSRNNVPSTLSYCVVMVMVAAITLFKKHHYISNRKHRSLLSILMVAVFTATYFFKHLQSFSVCVLESAAVHNNKMKRKRKNPYLVDCETVPIDTEPHYVLTTFPEGKQAIVDYPVWHPFAKKKTWMTAGRLFHQILNVSSNEAFIDVGANIGQMTMGALVKGKITYAFDPLEYDFKKICAAVKESLDRGLITQEAVDRLHLYRALVGKENVVNASISRPDEAFGKFEQASISPETIAVSKKPPKIVKEFVPMVTLDEVIPSNLPIGLVKIDVQGFEWPVVQGMKEILERKSGYPRIIHYEEHPKITQAAGFKLGKVQAYLVKYGYKCQRQGMDISCFKER